MAIEYGRSDRISSLIKRELAVLISREMQDPRAQLASVTAVELSRDKSIAQVFVISSQTVKTKQDELVKALNKASGFLRKKLGDSVYLKHIPKLVFIYDDSVERGSRISALIDNLPHNSEPEEN